MARLHAVRQGCDGVEAAWLGKGRNMLQRLAAALTLLNWAANASSVAPSPSTISVEMMSAAGEPQSIGLCYTCTYARRVASSRESEFWLCQRAAVDPRLRAQEAAA